MDSIHRLRSGSHVLTAHVFSICLFWGEAPASQDGELRAASPVNVVARPEDVGPLADLEGGAAVTLEAL